MWNASSLKGAIIFSPIRNFGFVFGKSVGMCVWEYGAAVVFTMNDTLLGVVQFSWLVFFDWTF